MTRRIWSAALALSLAGGVYLAGMPAQASNMGFKLERDFDFKRTSAPSNNPLRNVYWVSMPYFNGLGDVADGVSTCGAGPCTNKCVGETNAPPGPAGDGVINSFDIVCDWWDARRRPGGGAFSVGYVDSANCAMFFTSASIRLGQPNFGAAVPFPTSGDFDTELGVQVNIDRSANPADPDPTNRAVIVGSHDPSFAGHVIHYSTTCGPNAARVDLIAQPYHTMFQKSIEYLCGLRGVGFDDADNNWLPDDTTPAGCHGGLFDGARALAVVTVKNDDPALGGTSGFAAQSVSVTRLGGVDTARFNPATPFDLIPGEAYQINISAGHVDTIYRSPHF